MFCVSNISTGFQVKCIQSHYEIRGIGCDEERVRGTARVQWKGEGEVAGGTAAQNYVIETAVVSMGSGSDRELQYHNKLGFKIEPNVESKQQ